MADPTSRMARIAEVRSSGTLSLDVRIFADNLSQPQGVRIQLQLETDTISASMEGPDAM